MNQDDRASFARARVGSALSGYALRDLLGVGELGTVYAADSERRGSVALKLIHTELAGELGPALHDVARVIDEFGHPRVPKVLETTTLEGQPALVFQLLAGETVATLLARRRGRVPPSEALRIAADALEVVRAAHRQSLVHGSITPSRLFVADDGGVHVLGFGSSRLRALAKLPPNRAYALESLLGTPAADLWALAAILFALLTGVSVYGEALDAAPGSGSKRRPPRRLTEVTKDAPAALAELVDRALSVDEKSRFPDAATLLAAIHACAAQYEVHYAHALGSNLTRESIPPAVDVARITAPPISPVLGSSPYFASPSPPARHPTADFDSSPRAAEPAAPPRLTAPGDSAPRHDTLESWLHPNAYVVSPVAHTLPAPGAAPRHGAARADTHPALPIGELSPSSVRRRREADMNAGIVSGDEAETAALETSLAALDRAIGASPRERSDALDEAGRAVGQALARAPAGLTCRVLPDALETDLRAVWRAPGALEDAVRALWRGGVETLALLPGLGADELARFVEILSRDRAGRKTDMVSELYDADFSCIVFCAPNLLAMLDAEARAELESERRRLAALLDFDTSFQLEDAWRDEHGKTVASVAALDSDVAGIEHELPDMPPSEVGARLELDMDLGANRFAEVLISALGSEDFERAIGSLGEPLTGRIQALVERDARAALDSIDAVLAACKAPPTVLDERKRRLCTAILSERAVERLFARLGASEAPPPALTALVSLLDGQRAVALARALPAIADLRLRAQILHHLEIGCSGHEQALGELALSAEPPLALELVRLLARIETRAAGEALESCSRSPHVAIRIEALAARGGASGDRLKNELRKLLEEATPQARITTLRLIADAELRAAAPFIALRIRSTEFDGLVHEERRSLLNALVVLAPARAEAVALELLAKKGAFLGGAAQDESRLLAVDALGRAATSEEALDLLADLASGRRGSAELSAAASDALERRRTHRRRHSPSAPPGGKA